MTKLTSLVLATVLMAACSGGGGDQPTTSRRTTGTKPTSSTSEPRQSVTVMAAGDIASCKSNGDEATAEMLAEKDGTVVTLGDNVYEQGTQAEFEQCFDPSWGRVKERIHPSPGNHDYGTGRATGYFRYFGDAAGPNQRGYYSYDLGDWHVVSLNSNCNIVNCQAGGEQHAWLTEDLRSHKSQCTLAYWHHPRFSSGLHGSTADMADLYQALYDASADVALAGHDHHYERLVPMNPAGAPDQQRGIRNFVVGTGGRSHYPVARKIPGSESVDASAYGLLELELEQGTYTWRFVSVSGEVIDSGHGTCH